MRALAEVFPPGDLIREELDARDWTQADLAEIMGRPVETINRIIAGKLAVTPETAHGLGAAFGTSPELWLNLESSYQLARVNNDETVARRARLYDKAPIKDMLRRKWIETSSNVEVLEKQIVQFFGLRNLDARPSLSVAARKSTSYSTDTPSQVAWFCFAKRLASTLSVSKYSRSKLEISLERLRALAVHPNESRNIPQLLADVGVRLVVVKHLPKTKIDGAAFWIGKGQPAVALSLRYDRIDWFWHTLLHEIAHILHGDSLSVDSELVGTTDKTSSGRPNEEESADEFAVNFLVPREELDDFVKRVKPLYSKKRIVGFANRIGVHPGIVVGQLQHREEIGFSHSREMLAKVRTIITRVAVTDGWGYEAEV